MDTFPFEIYQDGATYGIIADIDANTHGKIAELFEKCGYEPNGYCWEGHIIQILEQLDEELIDHIDFDPNGGEFFAYADTQKNQERFVELLSPIFQDLEVLENYVKNADRDKVDN